VVFRKEPADTEVYQYFLNNYYQLKFTDGISAMPENPVNCNPKRRKREISKQLKVKVRESAQDDYKLQKKIEKRKAKHQRH
jgi:hypothetical protein